LSTQLLHQFVWEVVECLRSSAFTGTSPLQWSHSNEPNAATSRARFRREKGLGAGRVAARIWLDAGGEQGKFMVIIKRVKWNKASHSRHRAQNRALEGISKWQTCK
jgi:hypothetical protein